VSSARSVVCWGKVAQLARKVSACCDVFEEITPEDYQAQIETNLFGPLNVTRAVLPVMRAQRSGLVVTISSTAGIVGQEFCTAYAASKFPWKGGASR
jgi:NAD(P)-dependent dehydrogenase (short-subunit alcohol dehydrogenase family)